ncbi:MAG: hypothetical protein J0M07_14060 [Anaerolineae bacterium]|jgi:hypothetical protein|nr:hypothetical protein [Chloroflexota bacterium]MBN8636448.1 hypothetical protein [Anaerolineae bacterium]
MPDTEQRHSFFDALFARCTQYPDACLTLTALHPDGQHSTPSRHLPLHDKAALRDALTYLDRANALGWGAYFAVGLRRPGLNRWQRGGAADVVALPALFVDVDDPSTQALRRLQCTDPEPSCIVSSGGGYHAYWWLDEPTADFARARHVLHSLAFALHGDSLSLAQSLRVPGSYNTKPERHNAHCHLLTLTDRRYALNDFTHLLPVRASRNQLRPNGAVSNRPASHLITRVSEALIGLGCKPHGDWLNGACPFPEHHKHADRHPSFGYNTKTGYGFCHVCGTLLLKDLCPALGIWFLDNENAYSGS